MAVSDVAVTLVDVPPCVMASGMVAALGALGPLAVLATLFLITALVGLFISNSATAVLMAPIAVDAAQTLHDSPQAFAMTVALGCCAASLYST